MPWLSSRNGALPVRMLQRITQKNGHTAGVTIQSHYFHPFFSPAAAQLYVQRGGMFPFCKVTQRKKRHCGRNYLLKSANRPSVWGTLTQGAAERTVVFKVRLRPYDNLSY